MTRGRAVSAQDSARATAGSALRGRARSYRLERVGAPFVGRDGYGRGARRFVSEPARDVLEAHRHEQRERLRLAQHGAVAVQVADAVDGELTQEQQRHRRSRQSDAARRTRGRRSAEQEQQQQALCDDDGRRRNRRAREAVGSGSHRREHAERRDQVPDEAVEVESEDRIGATVGVEQQQSSDGATTASIHAGARRRARRARRCGSERRHTRNAGWLGRTRRDALRVPRSARTPVASRSATAPRSGQPNRQAWRARRPCRCACLSRRNNVDVCARNAPPANVTTTSLTGADVCGALLQPGARARRGSARAAPRRRPDTPSGTPLGGPSAGARSPRAADTRPMRRG